MNHGSEWAESAYTSASLPRTPNETRNVIHMKYSTPELYYLRKWSSKSVAYRPLNRRKESCRGYAGQSPARDWADVKFPVAMKISLKSWGPAYLARPIAKLDARRALIDRGETLERNQYNFSACTREKEKEEKEPVIDTHARGRQRE